MVFLWCGRTVGRRSAVGGRCTVTWLPNFLGWVDLLSNGAPPTRALRARVELRYKEAKVARSWGSYVLHSVWHQSCAKITSCTGESGRSPFNKNSDRFKFRFIWWIQRYPTFEQPGPDRFATYLVHLLILITGNAYQLLFFINLERLNIISLKCPYPCGFPMWQF